MILKDVIRHSMNLSDHVMANYLEGLSDADLLVRPIEGMNPIAWQVGHLIVSERGMLEAVRPGASPALPEGFEAAHPRDPSGFDPAKASTRDEYLALAKAQRAASLAALDAATDDELAAPAPERMARMAGSVAQVYNMIGLHEMMHLGQFVATRRALNKPVAI